jgi:hypothetical protein
VYVPLADSSFQRLEASVVTAADRLANVEFVAIAETLASVLKRADEILGDPRLGATLDDLQSTAESIRAIAAQAESLFDAALVERVTLAATDIGDAARDVRDITGRLNNELSESAIQGTVADIRLAAAQLRRVGERAEAKVAELDFAAAVGDARATLQEMSHAAEVVAGLRNDVVRSLVEFDRAMESVRRLADTLEENPAALIRGRPGDAAERGEEPPR